MTQQSSSFQLRCTDCTVLIQTGSLVHFFCFVHVFVCIWVNSVFVRDSTECKLLVACQQFRMRDCTQLDVALFCTTKPIIESSTTVRLACHQYFYPQLAGAVHVCVIVQCSLSVCLWQWFFKTINNIIIIIIIFNPWKIVEQAN